MRSIPLTGVVVGGLPLVPVGTGRLPFVSVGTGALPRPICIAHERGITRVLVLSTTNNKKL